MLVTVRFCSAGSSRDGGLVWMYSVVSTPRGSLISEMM